jgi:hypothetical protein
VPGGTPRLAGNLGVSDPGSPFPGSYDRTGREALQLNRSECGRSGRPSGNMVRCRSVGPRLAVIQVPLPDGRFAYGRVYRDATVCFYRYATRLPGEPPIGLRDFAFCVGVYDDVVASWEVVGVEGFSPDEDNGWPPASGVKDPISGSWRIYHRGAMRAATEDEARDLEPAAVWDERHLLPRLVEGLSES